MPLPNPRRGWVAMPVQDEDRCTVPPDRAQDILRVDQRHTNPFAPTEQLDRMLDEVMMNA